jgi:hypothetical protein
MLVNHPRRFIYIAIQKNASNSVFSVLEPLGFRLQLTEDYKDLYPASPLGYYDPYISDKFKDYFAFAFTRHPYRRMLSLYLYLERHPKNYLYPISRNGFKSFLHDVCKDDLFVSQSDFLRHCAIPVSTFKLEHGLQQLSKLGLNVPDARKNTSTYKNHWSKYFDEEDLFMVRKKYQEDFVKYKYEE